MPTKKELSVNNIRELKPLNTRTIDKKWEDDNEHINISFYMDCYNQSGWPMFELLGIDKDYFAERKMGVVDLENHIHYWRELHVDNKVTTYARFLNHDKKRLHGVLFVVNDDTNDLSCSIEFLALSIDQNIRKSAPFPDDVINNLSNQVKQSLALDWQFPAQLTLGKI